MVHNRLTLSANDCSDFGIGRFKKCPQGQFLRQNWAILPLKMNKVDTDNVNPI